MAEVMSMIPEENGPGELNAEEQDSLQVGEELEAQHEQMLPCSSFSKVNVCDVENDKPEEAF